jgi:hypothetical protein
VTQAGEEQSRHRDVVPGVDELVKDDEIGGHGRSSQMPKGRREAKQRPQFQRADGHEKGGGDVAQHDQEVAREGSDGPETHQLAGPRIVPMTAVGGVQASRLEPVIHQGDVVHQRVEVVGEFREALRGDVGAPEPELRGP